jgi:hypothetical protein
MCWSVSISRVRLVGGEMMQIPNEMAMHQNIGVAFSVCIQ